MKKIIVFMVISCAVFMFIGCGTIPKVATTIGSNIGQSFQEAAAIGAVNAGVTIGAWPYINGMITRAKNHGLELTQSVNRTIENLNRLAKKDFADVSLEEKGDIILSVCIVETAAIKSGWDKYGVSIWGLVKKTIGG